MTFDEAIEFYCSMKQNVWSASGRDGYSLKQLRRCFAGRELDALRRRDVRDYVRLRQFEGVKVSTIRRELCLLSAAVNFIRAEFELEALPNPVARLGLPKGEPRVRWISREEAARLIGEAERAKRPHLAVFIRLALNTGCRRGELLGLEWSRVDMEHCRILLEARHTKTRRRRTVPLNDAALIALDRMRVWQYAHIPVSPYVFAWEGGVIKGFKTSWATAKRRAGIEDFRIHDLRHTFASWLVMQGESIYVVRDLLGHASVRQTEIYAHLAPDQTKAAVERLLSF